MTGKIIPNQFCNVKIITYWGKLLQKIRLCNVILLAPMVLFFALKDSGRAKGAAKGRAEKRLSKRVFLESPFLLCPLKVCY